MWPLKRGWIHMKCFTTGKEKVTFICRWLLNRVDHMDMFDCSYILHGNNSFFESNFHRIQAVANITKILLFKKKFTDVTYFMIARI